MRMIFVCTSNVCRSPIAEAFAVDWFQKKLGLNRQELKEKGIVVQSAALTDAYEKPGSVASKNSIDVLHDLYGLDITSHRSQLLTQEMCNQADFIVCITKTHKARVLECFAFVNSRTVVCTLDKDVPDPWHMPRKEYEQTALILSESVKIFMDANIAEYL